MAQRRITRKSTPSAAKRRSSPKTKAAAAPKSPAKSKKRAASGSSGPTKALKAGTKVVRATPNPKSKSQSKSTAKTQTSGSAAANGEGAREGKPHSYWPRSSERQLILGLNEDLRDAYDRLKSTLTGMGAQYIYASAKAIMFARQRCYAFVRPKKKYLEITFFRDERITDERLKRVDAVSARKFAHIIHVTHADQIEEPLTEWLSGAYAEAPAGIPPNFRGQGGGDEVEIIGEGEGPRGFTGAGSDVDLGDIDPWDLER